jgi:hypothetical protein
MYILHSLAIIWTINTTHDQIFSAIDLSSHLIFVTQREDHASVLEIGQLSSAGTVRQCSVEVK